MTDDDEIFLEPEETLRSDAKVDPPQRRSRFKRATLSIAAVVVVLGLASGIAVLMSHDTAAKRALGPTASATLSAGSASASVSQGLGIVQQQSSAKTASTGSSAGTTQAGSSSGAYTDAATGPVHVETTQGSGPGRAVVTRTSGGGPGARPTGSGPPRRTTGPPSTTPSSAPSSSGTYAEEAYNKRGVPTFADYFNASGQGQDIPFEQVVQVICKVYNTDIQSVLPGGYWYKIASSPWTNLYAAANTFLNGLSPTSTANAYFDPRVRDC